MGTTLTGGCLCGAVRYRLTAAPREVSTCHCSMCQKAGGAAFQIYGNIEEDEIVWEKGEPRVARTSPFAERVFCGDCGSPLLFRYPGRPTWGLTIPSLDDPSPFAPVIHEGTESLLGWLKLDDGLPRNRTEDDPDFRAMAERGGFEPH